MNYYSLPKLLFYKNDGATVDLELFKKELFDFLQKEFEVTAISTEYGSSTYFSPDKDNQFTEGYTRPVYFQYLLKNNHKMVVQFYEEESSTNTFDKSWIYNFYSLNLYFVQGDGWTWIKSCWEKLKPFILQHSFYDATLSYTFDLGLYTHFASVHDEEGKSAVTELTRQEILERYKSLKSYLEIQHKPFLNINALLEAHPDKDKVNSIQINNNELKEFPVALFEYQNLQMLYVYGNRIEKADERFLLLKKLTAINLHSNPIASNPEELVRLRGYLPDGCTAS